MTDRLLKTGNGWRLGWHPTATTFKGLIGGQDWAIELTEAELNDFCRLTIQLSSTIQQTAKELMDEERINCEVESELIWLEVEGYPHAYSLRFMLLSGRRSEGYWPISVVPDLLQAIQVLKVF